MVTDKLRSSFLKRQKQQKQQKQYTRTSVAQQPLKRLINYGSKYKTKIWLATICSIVNKIFDLAPPILIGLAVDIVVNKDGSLIAHLAMRSIFAQLLILTFISANVWALESIFQYAYDRLWRNIAQNIQHDLRLDAYSHIQNLQLEYFEKNSTGGLLSILNDDINQLERFLDVGANEIIQVITTFLVISSAFFILIPSIAIVALLPIPFILWSSIKFQKKLAPRYVDVREKVSCLNTRLANNISGITTIKSFTTENYEIDRLRKESEAYRKSNNKAIALSAAFIPLIRMVILIGFSSILLFGGLQVETGLLEVGSYSALVFLTQRLLWPLTRLGQTLDLYQRAMASVNRVMNMLDTPMSIRSGEIYLPVNSVFGEIKFNNVSFAYHDRKPVIDNFSLDIEPGKTTAIVGSTGSGKSTLVKLLLRFYEIEKGSITLDGIELKDIVLYDLRRAIGLVSQDVFLFDGTIRQNIAYGNPLATCEEIAAAATMAEAHNFIMELPQKYETLVGERGQKLSGGQKQRLAIARAILKNPPILILDEATSSLDNETESAIARSLDYITRNRTTIAIAHRLSTIRHADLIYVLEDGKIVEKGKHEDLLAKNGVYANLWEVQTGARAKNTILL